MKPRKKRGRKKKRKATPGSFKKGPDPRRHTFTTQDAKLGYWVCAIKHPHLREWLQLKIRIERHNAKKEEDPGGRYPFGSPDDGEPPF